MTAGGERRREPGIDLVVLEQGEAKAVRRVCLLP
jgi:hypothetical protein